MVCCDQNSCSSNRGLLDGRYRWVLWAALIINAGMFGTELIAGLAQLGIVRSEDSGQSWAPSNDGLTGRLVVGMTISPSFAKDKTFFSASLDEGVECSTDGGETWSDMSAPLIKLAEQPHLQSSVGGRHCGNCEGMLDSHATAISPAAPDTVFLGLRMGLFRSDDRGATWYDTEIGRFSPLTYCHDVVVSPHDPRVVFTCLSPAAFSNDGSLYRSDDLAQSWRRIDHGIKANSTLMAVSVHPSDPTQVFCVTRGGQVFGTDDAGGSWQEYRLPSGVEDVYAVACR